MDFMGQSMPMGEDPGAEAPGGSSIDPAIIQALVMALLGQGGGGQENILQMLQQIDPRALQSLVFGGAMDGGQMPPAEALAGPPRSGPPV